MIHCMCVYYMTVTPERSPKVVLIEKPGIEPATPGLQGIALIHYTTGASQTLPKFNGETWIFSGFLEKIYLYAF